jgi:hypothetical protein
MRSPKNSKSALKSIEKAKQLTAKKFKRMTGVSRKTFELMVDVVKADAQKKNFLGLTS